MIMGKAQLTTASAGRSASHFATQRRGGDMGRSATTGLVVPRLARIAVAVIGCIATAGPAPAVEFLDGRVQVHGFGEMQVRALNEKFSQELDLAQWYNVLNLEFEFDIAPDGFGPFDLASAYVRTEARYDLLYNQAWDTFKSVNTYGNDAARLPKRLRDAKDKEFAGTNAATDRFGQFSQSRHDGRKPASIVPTGERIGFPGYDTFFRTRGPDDELGPNPNPNRGVVSLQGRTFDDPAWYVHERIIDYQFGLKEFRGTANTDTQILGPWLPKNRVIGIALNRDRGNPFRGRLAPTRPRVGTLQFVAGTGFILNDNFSQDPESVRLHSGEAATGTIVDLLDPTMASILNAPDSVWAGLVDEDGNFAPTDIDPGPGFRQLLLNRTFPARFGGDFVGGVAGCLDPTDDVADDLRDGSTPPPPLRDCIRGSVDVGPDGIPGTPDDSIYTDPRILGVTKMTGGGGENPFRPAPDVGNFGRVQLDAAGNPVGDPDAAEKAVLGISQGLYIPSPGTRQVLGSGRLDKAPVNFSQQDRSWNRGDAQERTKELKEAYVDLELLDSRLWLRLGLQNIVWGKTELFRTTDQFNPQDLALASLPSLEESRIAMYSARAVYSLYDVGPLEDVRLEFAANIDQYQNADIGACGEPYTPDVVCSLTTGLWAHSLLGIGVVGIDRPESPWKEPSDLEIGGRIEWRWDRFSFALTDFWGFSDFPYAESVFFYERAVDPMSGRPLVARLPGQSLGTCGSLSAGPPINTLVPNFYPNAAVNVYSSSYSSHPMSVTTGVTIDNPTQLGGARRGGIGIDPNCLRPGGPSGGFAANGQPLGRNALPIFGPQDDPTDPNSFFSGDGIDDDIDNTNALEWHSANQQIFSWVCAGTVGIAALLDASACAWTLFSTPEVLLPSLLTTPFVELSAILFAGSQASQGTPSALNAIGGTQKYGGADFTTPLVSLNALFNDPEAPIIDRNNDGGKGDGPDDATDCASDDLNTRWNCDLRGFDGFDGRVGLVQAGLRPDGSQRVFQTLDNSLTNEQRALLGCGPFFGTRCDSSANVNPSTIPGTPILVDPTPRHYARAGGVDFLNMEASALVQAWPGFEGTTQGHDTTASLSTTQQPGTVGFVGGPVCTRFVPSRGGTVKLPGCRGIKSLDVITDINDNVTVQVEFEEGYLPSIDGCVIGDQVFRESTGEFVDVVAINPSSELATEFPLCSRSLRERVVPNFNLNGYADLDASGDGILEPILTVNPNCAGFVDGAFFGAETVSTADGGSRIIRDPGTPERGTVGVALDGSISFEVCRSDLVTLDMLPMIHPTAGCIDSEVWFEARANNTRPADPNVDPTVYLNANGQELPYGGCEYFYERDLVEELFDGTAAMFQNELAAFSWNFMMFLAVSSCNDTAKDLDGLDHVGNTDPGVGQIGGVELSMREDPQCFDANRPWTPGRCSFSTPQFCGNVKGFLGAAGVRRNTITAEGNGAHGRRTFIWHGGGEIVLTYEQRNVLGFSMDFAEDVTKTNWGVEFTWIEDVPFADNNSETGITRTDAYNLTVSVDRPTFINFLNANRTFFFNSQWFVSYLPDYGRGFTFNGNTNVLFTFAMFTGYFQDRVLPQFVTVYDFNSRSGGVLPTMQYRFTESFSATVGMLYFFGRTQMKDMPVNEFGPPANRTGEKAYQTGVDNILSLIRKRDEVFLRLRWTF
jgi:hypothetical protein